MSQIIEKLKPIVYTLMFTLVMFLINSKYYFRIQIYYQSSKEIYIKKNY